MNEKIYTPDTNYMPNFSQRVLNNLSSHEDGTIHHNPHTVRDAIRLLALTSPWELDLLREKGILQKQIQEEKNREETT